MRRDLRGKCCVNEGKTMTCTLFTSDSRLVHDKMISTTLLLWVGHRVPPVPLMLISCLCPRNMRCWVALSVIREAVNVGPFDPLSQTSAVIVRTEFELVASGMVT